MMAKEGEFEFPEAGAQWCRAQDYQAMVAADVAPVDLNWWNRRLNESGLPVRLSAFDADGKVITAGHGFLRRSDLDTGALPDQGPPDLCALYRAVAWLSGHPDRSPVRKFVDVRSAGRGEDRLREIQAALAQCRDDPNLFDGGPFREWSGWPRSPGVGNIQLSLYAWAAHSKATFRPQLLDQDAVSTLCHLGWLETPIARGFTLERYRRYNELLHRWAADANVAPELVEMWLSTEWRRRRREAWGHAGVEII